MLRISFKKRTFVRYNLFFQNILFIITHIFVFKAHGKYISYGLVQMPKIIYASFYINFFEIMLNIFETNIKNT